MCGVGSLAPSICNTSTTLDTTGSRTGASAEPAVSPGVLDGSRVETRLAASLRMERTPVVFFQYPPRSLLVTKYSRNFCRGFAFLVCTRVTCPTPAYTDNTQEVLTCHVNALLSERLFFLLSLREHNRLSPKVTYAKSTTSSWLCRRTIPSTTILEFWLSRLEAHTTMAMALVAKAIISVWTACLARWIRQETSPAPTRTSTTRVVRCSPSMIPDVACYRIWTMAG